MTTSSGSGANVVQLPLVNTLGPLIIRYMNARRARGTYSPKSVRVVQPRLRGFSDHFGRRPIDKLTRTAVESWLESLAHLAPNSRAAYLASVRQFTVWLAMEGIVRVDPCVGIDKIRRARAVPRAQSHDAITATFRACRDDRDRAIIWLMVGLGLRRVEVSRLMWEHYDERARTILVKGKGNHERLLPVSDEVAHALELVRTRGNTGPIIHATCDTASPLQPDTIGRIAGRILRDAGLKRAPYDGVSGHALRHSAASDVLDRCGDLRVVQAMLGHEHLTSTAIYLRRAQVSELRPAMEGRRYAS